MLDIKNAIRVLTLALCAAAASAGLEGCGISTGSSGSGGTTTSTPSFATTIVIGDSLSAGFQNGSLLDTQQPNGWASLLAKQASFQLALPLIAPPGAPAVLQLVSVGPPPVIQQKSGTTTGRDNPTTQPYNLAVPGQQRCAFDSTGCCVYFRSRSDYELGAWLSAGQRKKPDG
jgi:hypothetical protein